MDNSILESIGITDGLHIEALVSTVDGSGVPNIAPMGVKRRGEYLYLKIYKDTKTYDNIMASGRAIINLTDDVELFFKSIFIDDPSSSLLDEPLYKGVSPAKGADAYIFVEVDKVEDKGDRALFRCRILDINVARRSPRFVTRCSSLVIESLIHMTRIKVYLERGDVERAEFLKELILWYRGIIDRICPDKPYRYVMENLVRRIEEWERGIG